MIEHVIEQRRRDLGGFEVGRVLPSPGRRMVGPFIFFDEMGPVDIPAGVPRTMDVRPHPHIGLATVTYLFSGQIMHRDSVGSELAIRPGEVNWMTAGRGITHSERFEHARAHGDRLHGIQAWVALPRDHEEDAPSFVHVGKGELPAFERDGLKARLIAGAGWGARSPVPVHSPLFYAHWELAAGAEAVLPPEYSERALYVVSGAVEIAGERHEPGRMLVFTAGASVPVRALAASTLMLLGGEPVGPRFIEWNFVSTSRERIEQAKAAWRAQTMPLPVNDSAEFTPLPG
jgi:redox-sensitive bicupin YhaK (pirin superfamily)